MQRNAETAPGGSTFERVVAVRAVPGRKLPLAIVHAFSATGAELAVQEKYTASPTGLDAAALTVLEADARRAMALRHPNVAAVRDVVRQGDEVSVITEFVEGEVLEELRRLTGATVTAFTLEVGVRIVVDVLSALSALHTLGTGGLAHGEVTTHNVIVGYDGMTRLVRPYRGRVAGKVAESDWFAYAAPEVLKGREADARSDLFSVGVLLWETLTKRQLFPKATREGRTSRNIPIGKATPPADASWANPLVAVVERALASDPQARYASAAEMAAAVRLAVRSKLAMPPRVAAVVDKLAGERILQRRVALALPEPTSRPSGRPSRPSMPNDAVRVLDAIRPSSRPPTPMPGPVIMPVVPKAPPMPSMEARPEARPGPRPAAPPIKLSDPKPPIPRAAPKVAVEVEPASIDGALLQAVEPSTDFGVEPPTIPKKPALPAVAKPSPPAAQAAEIAAPPAELLDVVKAVEVKLDAKPAEAAPAAASVIVDPSVITAPAPQEPEEPAELAHQPTAASVAPAGIGAQRGRRIVVYVAAVCALLLLVAGVRFLVMKGDSTTTVPTSQTAQQPRPKPTATEPAGTSTTTATAPVPSATVAEPHPEDSATPPPSTSVTPAPEGSRRHHTKPRPTYDPMGI